MSDMSNYLEGKLSDLLFQGTAYTAPDTYVALATGSFAEDNSGTANEVSGGSYARELVENDLATSPYWDSHVDGVTDNNADITFTTASANWGTVSHMGIYDASTVGNLLFHGSLSGSKTVDTNDTFKFATGDLDITLA